MSSKNIYQSMAFVITTIIIFVSPIAGEVPTTMNYQGLLTNIGGDPVADGNYSITFTIYDADTGGNSKWSETQSVATSQGLFSIQLGSINPILDSVFNQPDRYLGIQVESDPELTPRSRLTSSPYSQRISTVDGAYGGTLKSSLLFSDSLTGYSDPMMYLFETAPTSPIKREIFTRAPFWDEYGLSYTYGGAPGLEYFSFKNGPTIMSINMATHRVGIGTDAPDYTLDINGFIHADGVALGYSPSLSGQQATIGGGGNNTTSARYATVAGGVWNVGGGEAATVSGGHTNSANGDYAMSPGGRFCDATGHYTFAAGRRAKAIHDGTFVWADSTDLDFSSSAPGQFQIRATGGANIYTDASLSAGVTLAAGGSSWSAVSDSTLKRNIREVDYHEILAKVAELPISQWSYESQAETIEHVGPMAQDFYRIFGLGEDDKHINTLDPDGISLAAIKALDEKNKRLEEEVSELKQLVEKLIDSK